MNKKVSVFLFTELSKGEKGVVVNNKTNPLISSSSIGPGSHLPS